MFEPYRKKRETKQIAYEISCAQETDLPDIANITIERDGGDYQKLIIGLQQHLVDESSHLFVAKVGDKVVGFGKSRLISGEEYEYEGWYLLGLIVLRKYRGYGIGSALTKRRIEELKSITNLIYYFVNSSNRVSIELHDQFGFKKLAEPFEFPNVVFESGHGCLFTLTTNDL